MAEPTDKKGAKFGAIWDSMLDDAESDELSEKIPEVPKDLEDRTRAATEKAVALEVARHADPNSEEFKRRIAEFTGKQYRPPNIFKRAYYRVADYLDTLYLPW